MLVKLELEDWDLCFSGLDARLVSHQKMIEFCFDIILSVYKSLDIDMIFRVPLLRFIKGVNIPEGVTGCDRDIEPILLLATASIVKFEHGNSPSSVILYD